MEHLIHDIFPPHAVCWLWRWDIILTHFIGDILTALAYYAIPLTLYYLTRKYFFDRRLKLILWMYAIFIFLCGTTHIFDVVMIWYINETILILDGIFRVATGIFSVFSAVITFYVTRRFLHLARDFFGIAARMTEEQRELERIEAATWMQFEKTVNSMKTVLAESE